MKNKSKKIILILISILLITFAINISEVFASEVVNLMGDVTTPDNSGEKVESVISNVIGLIQFTGTGIALFTVTALGIKYMLAAPSEKADVKKNILPILIGCALLFSTVNIVKIIVTIANEGLS